MNSDGVAWPSSVAMWTVVAAILLDLLALATIWAGAKHSRKSKTLWTVLVIVLPVVGALGWFVLGQERRRRRK